MDSREPMAMRNTRVPPPWTRAGKLRAGGCPPWRWPVRMCTEGESPRWVTGMPAAAGTAKAEGTPGTTCTGTPASRRRESSSPPRPKRKGSPPFKRTTCRPAWAFSNKRRPISSWGTLWWPGSLPTSSSSAPGWAHWSRAGSMSRSYTTTSAWDRASLPRRVRSPGSPGPAPTNVTVPTVTAGPSLLRFAGSGPGPGPGPPPGLWGLESARSGGGPARLSPCPGG